MEGNTGPIGLFVRDYRFDHAATVIIFFGRGCRTASSDDAPQDAALSNLADAASRILAMLAVGMDHPRDDPWTWTRLARGGFLREPKSTRQPMGFLK